MIVLDEPTNGLDPAGIAEIRTLIQELSGHGYTILMASHLLDEVEKVCTHVAILKKGNLLLTGAVADVLQQDDEIEIAATDLRQLELVLAGLPTAQSRPPANRPHCFFPKRRSPFARSCQWLFCR